MGRTADLHSVRSSSSLGRGTTGSYFSGRKIACHALNAGSIPAGPAILINNGMENLNEGMIKIPEILRKQIRDFIAQHVLWYIRDKFY